MGCLNGLPLMAEVTYTRPFQTIGDDHPRPGTSTTQRTFSVVDQRTGTPVSGDSPLPDGPLNPGQPPGVEAEIGASRASEGEKASGASRERRARMRQVFLNCPASSRGCVSSRLRVA